MRDNPYQPYQSPARSTSGDTASRYALQKRQRRFRLLGNIAIVAGGFLLLLAFQMWDLLRCERFDSNGEAAWVTYRDHRPAFVIGGFGAALFAGGVVALAAFRSAPIRVHPDRAMIDR